MTAENNSPFFLHEMLMMEIPFSMWSFLVIFLAFFTACKSNPSVPEIVDEELDLKSLINGGSHYNHLVWDPSSTTNRVFNVSAKSPLHILLVRKKIGRCEVFYLKLKGILQSRLIACVGELSTKSFEQNCKWLNDSEALKISEGNIYGMPEDCGPWYMTIYVPDTSNTTHLSVEVSEPYDSVVFRWLRVITNLAFVPAVIVALKRGFYAEAVIYFFNFTYSLIYHLCEAELHCFEGYSRMHYSDYYTSDLSMITTVWTITRIKPPQKHILFLAIAIMLQFAVTETFNTTYHFRMNLIFAGPALIYICYLYVYRTLKYRRIYPSAKRWLYHLCPGFSLALTGALVNILISDPENYYYVHCIWHITIMLSVAFLLPLPADEDPDERWWMDKMDRQSYAPLL